MPLRALFLVFMLSLLSADFFSKVTLSKNSFNTISVKQFGSKIRTDNMSVLILSVPIWVQSFQQSLSMVRVNEMVNK